MDGQQQRFKDYAARFNALLGETGHGPALVYQEAKPDDNEGGVERQEQEAFFGYALALGIDKSDLLPPTGKFPGIASQSDLLRQKYE